MKGFKIKLQFWISIFSIDEDTGQDNDAETKDDTTEDTNRPLVQTKASLHLAHFY